MNIFCYGGWLFDFEHMVASDFNMKDYRLVWEDGVMCYVSVSGRRHTPLFYASNDVVAKAYLGYVFE